MVTMNVVDFPEDHQCPETSSLTQIAGLRENCGVTVRVPILSKWSSVRNGTRSMEMSCGQQLQRREKDATLSDQEYNFRAQLPAEFNGHITQSRQCELSCANHLRAKSSLNCLIHFSLPSYSALKPITLSPLRCASSKKTHLISTLLFLILYTTMAVAATSLDKGPLIKTDAADFHGRTRTFLAEGSSRRSFVRRIRSQKLTARSAELRPHITGKLDFQTLKVVKRWGDLSDILLVSGRNYVYLINPALPSSPASSGEGSYMERLKWSSSVDIVNSCRLMGKRQYECQNFIRVVEVLDNGLLYVCGTNAYSPVCRSYARSNFNAPSSEDDSLYVGDEEVCHGQCESPYNPTLASATLYANTTNGFGMFTAVINDFMGNKPVLMRKSDPFVYSMDKWFNEPTFIKLVEYKDGKMYLFFRETATTIETGTSTTATYARVAQVCKNDVGGVTVLRYQWTTFLKARLKCSISGSSRGQSFTFDNLTSVSEITEIQGQGGRPMDVIFATFSTPWDWTDLPMSAVCAFSMQTIQNLFEVGNFLGEQSLQSLPLNTGGDSLSSRNSIETVVKAIPVSQYDVPSPRPGTCPGPDTSTNDRILYFAKEHFLMYDPVLPLYEQPMYVSESGVRATHVTVDSNAGYSRKPVVYVGTENGNMLRLRPRLQITTGPRSVLLEEMQIVNKTKCGVSLPCGVLALHISRPEGLNLEPSAFVAFTDRLVQVPLAACNYTNAPCCNVDPECGWQNDTCVPRTLLNDNSLPLISDMSIIPTNCEETPVNDAKDCSLEDLNPEQRNFLCGCNVENGRSNERSTVGCPNPTRQSSSSQGGSQVNPRSPTLNNARTLSSSTMDDSTITRYAVGEHPETFLGEVFTHDVLPRIQDDFSSLLRILSSREQQEPFLNQLKGALIDTTELIMRNHRQEYCLPTQSVNSMTHVYPLLLHEIEQWHELALKKMSFKSDCFSRIPGPGCSSARQFFTASFAPSLWKPLTHLLTEFEANCDNVTTTGDGIPTHPTASGVVPGLSWCKETGNVHSPHCLVKTCRFPRYAVDVQAFFRHALEGRKFMPSTTSAKTFYKSVNVSITDTENVKGHIELLVNEDSPFEIAFLPTSEKVKITFYFRPVRDCDLNDRECSGSDHSCSPKLERSLGNWKSTIISGLKRTVKKCAKEINKLRRSRPPRDTQLRNKRSAADSGNELPLHKPKRCRYIRKKNRFPNGVWTQLVERARERGGYYSDGNERIEFNSAEDVATFFENYCADTQTTELGRTFPSKGKGRSRSSHVEVRVFVSGELPFIIEKSGSNKVRFMYFSHIPDN